MALLQKIVTNPALIWVLIPIIYFVVSGICEFTKLVHKHQERMALIRQGIHPDLVESDRVPGPGNTDTNYPDPVLTNRETVDYRSQTG